MTKKNLKLIQSLQKDKKYLIVYKSEQSGLKKSYSGLFYKKSLYLVETSDYYENEFVKEAKKSEVLGNGNAGKFEKQLFPFVYLNSNTQKIKLRVPVKESKVISYFYKGNEVTKEIYMKELEAVGWKPKSVSYLWNRFQSFDIEKIESISAYGK